MLIPTSGEGGMAPSENERADFRSGAVAASEAMRRALPSGLTLEKSGMSYCVEREDNLANLRAPIKLTAVVCAVLGLSGLAAGAIVAALVNGHVLAEKTEMLATAFCCFAGGSLVLLVPVFVERRIVRRHLSPRDQDFVSDHGPKGIHVALEDAATASSLKLLAEDVGLLYIHPERHCVNMVGLSYEYLIHSKDVVRLSLHSNRKNVLLSYVVGEEQLDVVILPRSLWAEAKRQKLGSSRTLFVKMQSALEPARFHAP